MSSHVTVLYATVSGNAEALAAAVVTQLRAAGQTAEALNMADYPPARLAEERTVLIIASTWGEGALPPDAEAFCAALAGHAPLPRLRYAVLALGSRAYGDFCGGGRRIDEALEKCGATRLRPRVECDTKYKADFGRWLAAVLEVLAPGSVSGERPLRGQKL